MTCVMLAVMQGGLRCRLLCALFLDIVLAQIKEQPCIFLGFRFRAQVFLVSGSGFLGFRFRVHRSRFRFAGLRFRVLRVEVLVFSVCI